MAVRQATLDLRALSSFLEAWQGSLSQAAVVIPAGVVQGELAPEFKLDLMLPLVGRVGPITCQIIQRLPDGSVAARIPEMPSKVEKSAQQVIDFVEEVRLHLLATGQGAVAPQEPTPSTAQEPAAVSPPPEPEAPSAPAAPAAVSPVEEEALVDDEPPAAAAAPLQEPVQEPVQEPQQAPTQAPARTPSPEDERSAREPRAQLEELPDVTEPVERGFVVPRVDGLVAVASGLLGDKSLRAALLAMSAEEATGLLTLTTLDDVTRWGFWYRGGPVGWRSSPEQADERLGALLRSTSQPGPELLAQADRIMERKGLRLGEALVAMGVVTDEQREVLLRRQNEFILKRVLSLREGAWTFHRLDSLPDRFDCGPTSVPTYLYRAVLGHALGLPPASVFAVTKQRGRLFACPKPGAQTLLSQIAWTRPEAELIATMSRKPERLDDLIKGQSPGDLRLAATLLSLVELGVFELSKFPGQRLTTLADLEERLRQRGPRAQADNHFDRLELHWICLPDEIDQRFKRLLEEFELSAFPEIEPELKAQVEAFILLVKEAYGVLKDADARRAYRKEVIDAEIFAGALDLLAQRARAAMQAGDLATASGLWARALEIDPLNAEFKQGLAESTGKKR